MGETGYLAAFIAVAAIATFATRVIPFLFLSGIRSTRWSAISADTCQRPSWRCWPLYFCSIRQTGREPGRVLMPCCRAPSSWPSTCGAGTRFCQLPPVL